MGLSIWEGNKAKDATEALQTIAEMQKLKAQYHGLVPINNWNVIGSIVREGKGSTLLPVGYQITDGWVESEGATPLDSVWDVVHYDASGNMTLNWHYALSAGVQFDAPEAIYYAPSGGLAAGQYYITISVGFGTGWVAGQHINFTLNNAMAEGDQLVISTGTNNTINPTAGRTWNVYAKGSTTSKDTGTTSDSDTGTELGATHGTKLTIPNGQINAPQRVVYGYNRYAQSAYRQYLNSAAAVGGWWTAQNGWDRPPSQLATMRGWLAGCSSDFVSQIATTAVVTYLEGDDATAESKTTDTTNDKIFLPSLNNLYIASDYINEGDEWDYYKELAQESGLPGKFQRSQTYPILIKHKLDNQSSSVFVWLRSTASNVVYSSWSITAGGFIGYGFSVSAVTYMTYLACPACKILKS